MRRNDSRATLCKYGRFDTMAYRDWISSSVKVCNSPEAGAADRSSARRRFWIAGFWARSSKVHVILRDEVSEPANMKVLMLCNMSSSEIRYSGRRSVARFDFTVQKTIGQ